MKAGGALYNAFVCFITGITGLLVFYLLYKKRKKKSLQYNSGVGCFSLVLGMLWFLIGLGALFNWLGYGDFHTFFYKWFIGPVIYSHLLPAFYYFSWSFFKNRKRIRFLFNMFFLCMALVAVFTHFKYGFIPIAGSYWGKTHKFNPLSQKIFTIGLFFPGFICVLIELIRRYKEWRKTGSFMEKQLFGFALGFLAYSITGFLEALVFTQEWTILLGKIGMMVGPLIFYYFATLSDKE